MSVARFSSSLLLSSLLPLLSLSSLTACIRLCHLLFDLRATPRRTQSRSIYPKMANTWMPTTSAQCPLCGDHPSIHDRRFEKYCDIAVGTWIRRWRHRNERGASFWQGTHELKDSPFVLFYEEVYYELRLGPIVAAHCAARYGAFRTSLSEVFGFFRPTVLHC